MGLALSKVFTRLFGKKEMRILMASDLGREAGLQPGCTLNEDGRLCEKLSGSLTRSPPALHCMV
jgi:hypothetical protein